MSARPQPSEWEYDLYSWQQVAIAACNDKIAQLHKALEAHDRKGDPAGEGEMLLEIESLERAVGQLDALKD